MHKVCRNQSSRKQGFLGIPTLKADVTSSHPSAQAHSAGHMTLPCSGHACDAFPTFLFSPCLFLGPIS